MPKTNDQTGATYAGMTGVVEHGAPLSDGRTLSELDPERELYGELIEGEHPNHPDGEKRDVTQADAPADIEPIQPREDTSDEAPVEEKEAPSSPGSSSTKSRKNSVNTTGRNSNRQ